MSLKNSEFLQEFHIVILSVVIGDVVYIVFLFFQLNMKVISACHLEGHLERIIRRIS